MLREHHMVHSRFSSWDDQKQRFLTSDAKDLDVLLKGC